MHIAELSYSALRLGRAGSALTGIHFINDIDLCGLMARLGEA
jgi:hypothetical protein